MVRHYHCIFIAMTALMSIAYGSEKGRESCFPPVTAEKDTGTNSYISIVRRAQESASGPQEGDRVIGLDGYRISTMNEYRFLQSKGLIHNKPLNLTVIRGGEIMNVAVQDCLPARRHGFYFQPSAGFPYILALYGTSLESLVESVTGVDPKEYVLTPMDRFPGACQRELARLAMGNAKEKAWGNRFLKLFVLMSFEKYAEAQAEGKALLTSTQGIDPWIVQVVQYYCRIAEQPPQENSFPLEHYGVSREFAAFYYPFPAIRIGRLQTIFPDDPECQKVFEAKLYGGPDANRRELSGLELRPEHKGAERYLVRVKWAVFFPERHGGWPYRIEDVARKDSREELLKSLRKLFNSKPNDRFFTSLGLVVVGVLHGSKDDVRLGMSQLSTLGVTEMGIVNNILANAFRTDGDLVSFRKAYLTFLDIQNEALEKNVEVPSIYRYLLDHSPYFHYRGMSSLFGLTLTRGADAIPDEANAIAPFLNSDVTCNEMETIITEGLATDAQETKEKAFRYSTLRLANLPGPYAWNNEVKLHLKLADAIPVRTVFLSYINIVTTHMYHGVGGWSFFKIRDVIQYLQKRQSPVLSLFPEVDKWENDDTLVSRAARFFDENGSPVVCLKLHEKLKRAGKADAARRYFRLAGNYYLGSKGLLENRTLQEGPDFELLYRLISDLGAAGESGAMALELSNGDSLKSEPYAMPVAVNAFALADQGNWTPAISELARAFTLPPIDRFRKCGKICFDGKQYSPSDHRFPEALGKSWLENPALSENHKKKIETILSRWEAVKKRGGGDLRCHQLIAVPAKVKPVIDGSLEEWDLSGQVILGRDKRFSGASRSQIALAYDDKFLYLGIHHEDPSPMDNDYIYQDYRAGLLGGDSVILRYLCGDKSGTIRSWYSNNQKETVIHHEKGKNKNSPIGGGRPELKIKSKQLAPYDCAFRKDPDGLGYTQEIAIPWKVITGKDSRPTDQFKMCVGVNWYRMHYGRTFYTNFKEGVQRMNIAWKRTSTYGDVILSPTGNLKPPHLSLEPLPDPEKLPDIRTITMKDARAIGLECSSSKKAFVVAKDNGMIEMWDYASGKAVSKFNTRLDNAKGFAFRESDHLFAMALPHGDISTWKDNHSIKLLNGHVKQVLSMDLSGDEKYMVSAGTDKLVVLWDMALRKATKRWPLTTHGRYAKFSGDGKQFSVGEMNGTVHLFDTQSDQPGKALKGHMFSVNSLCFSEDGKSLASGSSDMTIIVWDARSGKKISQLIGHTAPVSGVCFANETTLLSTSYDGTLREWDIQTGAGKVRYKDDGSIKYLGYSKTSDAVVLITLDNALVLVGIGKEKGAR